MPGLRSPQNYYRLGKQAYDDERWVDCLKYLFTYQYVMREDLAGDPAAPLLNQAVQQCEEEVKFGTGAGQSGGTMIFTPSGSSPRGGGSGGILMPNDIIDEFRLRLDVLEREVEVERVPSRLAVP